MLERYSDNGYTLVYAPNHPKAIKSKYILEHRLVMERYLGRLLDQEEHVHHRNGNRADNQLENLQLLTAGEHAALTALAQGKATHMRKFRWVNKPCYLNELTTHVCPKCHQTKQLSEFHNNSSRKSGRDGYCKECKNGYIRQRQGLQPRGERQWDGNAITTGHPFWGNQYITK